MFLQRNKFFMEMFYFCEWNQESKQKELKEFCDEPKEEMLSHFSPGIK